MPDFASNDATWRNAQALIQSLRKTPLGSAAYGSIRERDYGYLAGGDGTLAAYMMKTDFALAMLEELARRDSEEAA